MSLLDIINRNIAGAVQPGGVTDEAARAKRLLQARSGKAVAPNASASSNVAEQVAVGETNQSLSDVASKGTDLSMQLGKGLEQAKIREGLESQGIDLAKQELAQGFQQRLSTLGQKSQQEAQTLDIDKQSAGAEQRAMQRALGNKQYLDQLKRAGDQRRLGSELEFKRSLATNAFGNNEQLLKQLLGNKEALAVDERAWRELVASIDLSTAMQTAQNAMSDARTKQAFESTAQVAQAGIDISSKQNAKSGEPQNGQ